MSRRSIRHFEMPQPTRVMSNRFSSCVKYCSRVSEVLKQVFCARFRNLGAIKTSYSYSSLTLMGIAGVKRPHLVALKRGKRDRVAIVAGGLDLKSFPFPMHQHGCAHVPALQSVFRQIARQSNDIQFFDIVHRQADRTTRDGGAFEEAEAQNRKPFRPAKSTPTSNKASSSGFHQTYRD